MNSNNNDKQQFARRVLLLLYFRCNLFILYFGFFG